MWYFVCLLLGIALATSVDESVVQWSFDACRQDPPCAARWQLSRDTDKPASAYERKKFDEMMAIFLERREDGGIGAVDIMAACNADAESDAQCNTIGYMWLGMLREAHVCDANEEWVVDHGCHCMDGKHCKVDCTDASLSDLWSFTVAVAIIGIGVMSVFIWEVRKEEDLSAAVERRMTLAANNYYLASARLYVSDNAPMMANPVMVTPSTITNRRDVQI